jgi:hypothetical protein
MEMALVNETNGSTFHKLYIRAVNFMNEFKTYDQRYDL